MYTKTNVVVKCWFNLLTIFLDTEQLTSSTFMQLLKNKTENKYKSPLLNIVYDFGINIQTCRQHNNNL